MTATNLTHEARREARRLRNQARSEILGAANKRRAAINPTADPLTGRNIQLAVCIARRNRLVTDLTLSDAGYREVA